MLADGQFAGEDMPGLEKLVAEPGLHLHLCGKARQKQAQDGPHEPIGQAHLNRLSIIPHVG